MKKFLLIIAVFSLCLGSCKSDSKSSDAEEKNLQTESNSEWNTISGEFIYADSVAVFNKKNAIYGVIMNSKAKELIAQVQEIDSDPFVSFDVTLEVDIKDNPEKEAWPQVIEIQNIINVKPSSSDDSLRLNKQE